MKAQTNQFIGCDKPFASSRIVLFGAPYDSTTSFRPGTRFGPSAMRAESFGIETYSMLADRDLDEDADVFDSGDLELPFGAPDRALEMIEERAAEIFEAGKIPFLLGGEHLVTLGAVRAAAKRHPSQEYNSNLSFSVNKKRTSDTKGLRFLLTNSFVCGTIKLINTAMLFNLLYQKERHNESVCSTPHLW